LRAEHLLDRLRPPRAGLHRRVVRDDHDLAAMNDPDARHHARTRRLPVVLIVRHEQADLEKARALVREPRDPLARRQLSLFVLSRDLVRSAAFTKLRLERPNLRAQLAQPCRSCLTRRHASCPSVSSRSENHSRMYSIRSVVGVPGPNNLPMPSPCNDSMSSRGM